MTCIVGLISNNKLYMGSDSQCTNGNQILPTSREKIFTIGNLTLGTAGDVRFNNIIKYYLDVPYHHNDISDMEYICTEFLGNLRSAIEGQKFSEEKDNVSSIPNYCELLVAYKNTLYAIWYDYSVVDFSEYYAIGSGSDFALGSLETTKQLGIDPKERIELALGAACKFNVNCALPFNIVEKSI